MANERITDFFIGKLLADACIQFTPNGSDIKEVQEALKTASKKGNNRIVSTLSTRPHVQLTRAKFTKYSL